MVNVHALLIFLVNFFEINSIISEKVAKAELAMNECRGEYVSAIYPASDPPASNDNAHTRLNMPIPVPFKSAGTMSIIFAGNIL